MTTAKAKHEPAKHDPMKPGLYALPDPRHLLQRINEHIVIEPKAPRSATYKCGEDRLRPHIKMYKLKPEEVLLLTHACYELKAGSAVPLTVSFVKDGKPAKPKGVLRLTTDRGKLVPTTIELNGTQSRVSAELVTPDETIKLSVRAFVEGFRRGKVHLHLD